MSWFEQSDQFKRGKKHERKLDDIFSSRGWAITQTTKEEERTQHRGDRVYRKGDDELYIEYKSDETASRTGNLFIETVSVDTDNVPGWAYTCQADWIFYYLPFEGLIYVIKPGDLRKLLPRWQKDYPTISTNGQSKGYNTHGILVPQREFEEHAQVINL